MASTTGQKYAQLGYSNFLLNPKPESMNLWPLSAVQPWEAHVTSLTLSFLCYKSEILILPADSAHQEAPAPWCPDVSDSSGSGAELAAAAGIQADMAV